uniref:Ubiquitin carboxyl-terminal hydrolase n=1 Tax=Sarcophilus harrisii TaxID=9305 RepID=A0A7N4NGJ7_SARHA
MWLLRRRRRWPVQLLPPLACAPLLSSLSLLLPPPPRPPRRHGQDPGGPGELVAPAAAQAGDSAQGGGVCREVAGRGAVRSHVRPDDAAHPGGPGPLPEAGRAPGAGGVRPLPPPRVRELLQQDVRAGPPAARLPLAGQEGRGHPRLHPQRAAPHHELPVRPRSLQRAAGGGAAHSVRAARAGALRAPLRPAGRLRAVRAQGQAGGGLLPAAGAHHRALPVRLGPGEGAARVRGPRHQSEPPAAEHLESRARHAAALAAGSLCQHLLHRMIDWLSWPLAQHVETWVIALLKGLAAVQKFTILIDVTLLKIELVFNRLWFPLVRPGALAVLSHMLLSFQHSPEAFHLIVPHVVNLVHSFRTDGLPSSTAFLVQLTELIHCMMYHYSGFPDLYEPILEAIKDFPKPSEEKIKLILNQSAWTSQSNSLASCLSKLSGKSETGKTGLINLGNTCYMNSVIQALFMATDFRRHVLSLNLNGCNSLMKKLQHLFAFLAHTQREAYAPRIFFEASRPPWFTPRSQQDCSEYLRFLLDRLHEEERTLKALSSLKPSESMGSDEASLQEVTNKTAPYTEIPYTNDSEKTLIEKMFGGKLQTNIHCLNCRSTSQKEEAFTDLSLAFCPSSSMENLSFQGPSCSPKVQDDFVVQASLVTAGSPEESAFCHPVPPGFGSETVMDEAALDNLPSELPCTENTLVSNEPCKIQINRGVSQKPGGENTPSVTDLLNYFLAPEILNGDNRYYCENCASLQNAEKTMQIMEEPEYLILTLLRFSYDQKCHIRRKILDNVSLPLVLELPVKRTNSSLTSLSESWSVDVDFTDTGENLAKKLKSSGTDEACCPKRVPYLLSSVVVHSGISSESGHYYSYARNITGSDSSFQLCHQSETLALASPQGHLLGGEIPSAVIEQDLENNEMSKEWFLFNDSRVTFTSFQSVQKITSRFPKDTAYVLLYKKQNSTSGFGANNATNGLWVNGDPPLQKELMDAITKDNKLYLQVSWRSI